MLTVKDNHSKPRVVKRLNMQVELNCHFELYHMLYNVHQKCHPYVCYENKIGESRPFGICHNFCIAKAFIPTTTIQATLDITVQK